VENTHFALDGKKLVENEVCVKESYPHDVMEIIKHNITSMLGKINARKK